MRTQHTPGPWKWFGDAKHGGFYLATTHSGRQFVMDFTRMGFNGAQPRFQEGGIMVDARHLVRFEVAPHVKGFEAAKVTPEVYRYDIIEIDHPDACLIAAAPELLDALKQLTAQMDCEEARSKERDSCYGAECLVFKRAYSAIAKAEGKEEL